MIATRDGVPGVALAADDNVGPVYANNGDLDGYVEELIRTARRDPSAVVRGTGINQDGRTPGLTLPSSDAQERLIRTTYASAGLNFDDTTLVEAHGTGTKQGDAIEARGIAQAFKSRRKDKPLYLGSVKASVGHLEGAAGVAGYVVP